MNNISKFGKVCENDFSCSDETTDFLVCVKRFSRTKKDKNLEKL